MTVGLRCGSRTRCVYCISPSRAVAGLVDFGRNVVCMMYRGLCHLTVSIEADIAMVIIDCLILGSGKVELVSVLIAMSIKILYTTDICQKLLYISDKIGEWAFLFS